MAKMLLKSEILKAQSVCKSGAECARYLNVSFPTYKKYAKMHGVYERAKNKAGKGISKNTGKHHIQKYVDGEKDHQNPKEYLQKLIKYGYKKDECESCGWNEGRVDGKKPYVLHFKDGDKYNSKLENVEILCYNCYYINIGLELIGRKTRRYWTTDYFSKARDDDYSKYNEFEYDDFDTEDIENKLKRKENEQKAEELFEKFNS